MEIDDMQIILKYLTTLYENIRLSRSFSDLEIMILDSL